MFILVANVTAEILTNNALPRWEERFIEEFLKFLSEVDILDFALSCHALLDEFDSSEPHI